MAPGVAQQQVDGGEGLDALTCRISFKARLCSLHICFSKGEKLQFRGPGLQADVFYLLNKLAIAKDVYNYLFLLYLRPLDALGGCKEPEVGTQGSSATSHAGLQPLRHPSADTPKGLLFLSICQQGSYSSNAWLLLLALPACPASSVSRGLMIAGCSAG